MALWAHHTRASLHRDLQFLAAYPELTMSTIPPTAKQIIEVWAAAFGHPGVCDGDVCHGREVMRACLG